MKLKYYWEIMIISCTKTNGFCLIICVSSYMHKKYYQYYTCNIDNIKCILREMIN